jgi:hypothetical protein
MIRPQTIAHRLAQLEECALQHPLQRRLISPAERARRGLAELALLLGVPLRKATTMRDRTEKDGDA